ncbi:hypothetical protein [Schlesneria sp. DSM 10557]|uniref:hypothetical protein n=1 Tax=Schlesneria sp. DSM 10557 TaxID=3044399 RepID=UPI00359FBCC2
MDWIPILSRWTHVGTAIILVGGAFFIRFVLTPAASQLPDDEHTKLKELVMNKWKRFVHAGILLFLVSGFYNYLAVQAPRPKPYHMLMGIKMLLAFTVFFLISALVGRSKAFEGMRKNSKRWQLVVLILAAAIVGISGYLKVVIPKLAAG